MASKLTSSISLLLLLFALVFYGCGGGTGDDQTSGDDDTTADGSGDDDTNQSGDDDTDTSGDDDTDTSGDDDTDTSGDDDTQDTVETVDCTESFSGTLAEDEDVSHMFELTGDATVTLALSWWSGSVVLDLYLLDDNMDEISRVESESGDTSLTLVKDLYAGTYYASVVTWGEGDDYTVEVSCE